MPASAIPAHLVTSRYKSGKDAADHHTFNVFSEGVDPDLQGIGSSPIGNFQNVGLRVPLLAQSDPKKRYLFMLCGFMLAEGQRAIITNVDLYWSLYAKFSGPPASKAEILVADRTFKLPDANVSYSIRKINGHVPQRFSLTNGATDLSNFRFRMATSPCLLYETATLGTSGFYTDITAYTPPNGGVPYGDELTGEFMFHEPRATSLASYDLPVQGPAFFCLMASVRQSTGNYTEPPTNAGSGGAVGNDLNFIESYGGVGDGKTGVIIGRVYGGLTVKVDTSNGMPEQPRLPLGPCRLPGCNAGGPMGAMR